MTWYNASSYCFDNGGILESNETIIKEYSLNIMMNEVWAGSYYILSKWYGIWGKLISKLLSYVKLLGGRRDHDRKVVGFTIICAISACHQ
jgi:hypothetical protein